MPRQYQSSAISIVVLGLIVAVMLMAGSGLRSVASARLQSATPTYTACPGEEQDFCDEDATDNAQAYYDTQTAIIESGATSTATSTATTSSTGATSTSSSGLTPTFTATATRTPPTGPGLAPTSAIATPFAARVPAPTPTAVQPLVEPSETPIPTPADALTCYPGDPISIVGSGPPRAAFLLFFGQRAVSGGSVSPSGRFAITLVVGRERAGIYPVEVRVRGTSQVLRQLTCSVPDIPPSPLPRGRDLP